VFDVPLQCRQGMAFFPTAPHTLCSDTTNRPLLLLSHSQVPAHLWAGGRWTAPHASPGRCGWALGGNGHFLKCVGIPSAAPLYLPPLPFLPTAMRQAELDGCRAATNMRTAITRTSGHAHTLTSARTALHVEEGLHW